MSVQAGQWHFLTNHARVLFAIARDPAARLRDIAKVCRITERTAQSIVTDLEQAGYIRREREGRRGIRAGRWCSSSFGARVPVRHPGPSTRSRERCR
ncbi:MarR family transcriptional regulator [Streptomyces bobili]|uniref:MarR family transcriptional regulator n=1 Tax=Streptomyces bobili TaxID=67280 RepID=UPI00382E7A7D